jgi:hypothetical protein
MIGGHTGWSLICNQLDFAASAHSRGAPHESQTGCLHLGRGLDVACLGRDLLRHAEHANAKMLGGAQGAAREE